MNIKNKLFTSAIISVVSVVILISLILVTSNIIAEKNKQLELVDDVRQAVSELDIVTYEYLLHHETRMEQQWNLRYSSIAEILEKAEEEEEEEEEEIVEIMTSIHVDYIYLGDLFSQLTANYEKKQNLIQEGASQEKIDANILLEERLASQLLIKSQSITTDVSRLTEKISDEVMDTQELFNILALTIMIILAVIVIATSIVAVRSISKPIIKLADAAKELSKGKLDTKIDIKSKDEIGELADAFTDMAKDLREQRDGLENLVLERTKELETKIDELQRYKKVTVGRELKMRELKKRIKDLEKKKKK